MLADRWILQQLLIVKTKIKYDMFPTIVSSRVRNNWHCSVYRRLAAGLCVAVSLILLFSGGVALATTPENHADITTRKIPDLSQQKDTLVVGSEEDYPPFATGMTDETAGGFSVELWEAVAAEAGLKYTIRVRPFRQLLQEFKAGKIDVLINLAQSEERQRFADFTVPHVVVHGAIFVRKGESGIRTEEDIAGKSIIVINADLAHDYALSKGWGKQLVLVDTAAQGMRLLASGQHDAMLVSKLAGMQTLQELGLKNIKALKVKAGFEQKFAFAVQEGKSDLLGKLNEGLALVKSNGKYDALYEKWFGIYEPEEIGLRGLLKYLVPVGLFLLGIAGYFFYRWQTERTKDELVLKESESRFRTMANAAPVHIWTRDQDKKATWFNQTALEFTGLSLEQALGTGWSERLHPDDLQRCYERFAHHFERRETFSTEFRLKRHDGKYRWILDTGSPRFDEQGNFVGYIGSAIDINDRVEAEEKLQTLSTAIEQSPISVVITNAGADIEYVNPRFEDVTGYSSQESIGQNMRFIKSGLTPRETYADLWSKVTNGQVWHGELTNRRKNGELYWEEMHIAPVKNVAGELTHYVAAKVDITRRKKNDELLQENEQRYHFLFNNNPMPMWVFDEGSLKFLEVNDRAVEHYGFSREEFSRMTLLDIRPAEDIAELKRVISNSPDGKISGEFRHKKKDGTIINVVIRTASMKYGASTARIALMQDITEQKRAEETLRESENRFRFMLENSPIAVRIANIQTSQVVFSNQRYAELINSSRDKVLGIDPKSYYAHPQDYTDAIGQITRGERVTGKLIELIIPGEHPTKKWALASYLQLEYQNEPAVLGWFYDITDRKAMEEQVRHMAHYDPLTDLPNRTLFSDRLRQALAVAKRDQTHLAIMFIDLDRFKPVNDTLGHEVGDQLLNRVARRIQDCLRESDTVARIGGDEFIVLLPGIEREQDASSVAEKIRYALVQPFEVAGHSLSISSSIGIVLYPEHGHEEKELIKNADTAMYHAKASGRDKVMTYRSNMQK